MKVYYQYYYIVPMFICAVHLVQGNGKWTSWYNTDTPTKHGNDVETLNKIKQLDHNVCKFGRPEAVECRVKGTTTTFVSQQTWQDNILQLPCSIDGISCYLDDQISTKCHDYEIRFMCATKEADDLSNNGGFIALAAGFSVLIPLVCVLALQLKKARSARNSVTAPERLPQPEVGDLPPSYAQLFGVGQTITSLGQRSSSTEVLLSSSRDSSLSQSNPALQTINSIHQSHSSLQTISGNSVSDVAIETGANYSQTLLSRYPDMHISILDLTNNFYIQNDTTPPPSYLEALEILKSNPKS